MAQKGWWAGGGVLVRSDERLGEESPDGADYGENRANNHEEVGAKSLASGYFVLEESKVKGEGETERSG